MLKKTTKLTLCALVLFFQLPAQTDSLSTTESDVRRQYTTTKIKGEAPVIDGLGTDAVWEQVEWGGDFKQFTPEEGAKPSMQTSFKILYDDKNLYILVRAHDDEPEKIVKRMSRRDGFVGDWVEVNIDSYYDKRTAFSFNLNAAGVKGDEYVSNDGNNWDGSWDPIWYAKSSIDAEGWIAEMRIPLSQLRFGNKEKHIWGIQLMRYFFRNEERSTWQPFKQNMGGWVQYFGELHGIEGIKSQKQLEIMPYVVGKAEKFEKEEGNPYLNGTSSNLSAGVDGKIGLTSDITLDFTINPDFGQVEADPSTVNLSAFQLFFREQRPFFVEGNNILNFPLTQSIAGGPFNNDNLFYSRRIGRNPHHYPDTEDDEYVKQPDNTSIIGALKLTGKNKNGFSFGILESVTSEERALISNEGTERKETVEPMTNYLVARVQQDIDKGNTIIGGMFTATNRKLDQPHLDFLHKDAYSGGIDFQHFWKKRTYYANVNGFFSHVKGSTEAILETQTAGERFFQRPDNQSRSVDTTLTSLTGSGATVKLGKQQGNLRFQTGMTFRSPGLDLNDIGFMRNSDQIDQWTWVGYNITEPFSVFRRINLNFNEYLRWDFDGVNTYKGININTHVTFKNLWRFSQGTNIRGESISNSDLRGGPSIIYPPSRNYWVYISSDTRKKLTFEVNPYIFWQNHNAGFGKGIYISSNYQPIDALKISIEPSVDVSHDEMQYVNTIESDEGDRFLTGRIDQKTYSLSLRLTYNINPNLSIQYWGQPFNSRGSYSRFKNITDPSSENYYDRFDLIEDSEISLDTESNVYQVDRNKDGIIDYTFDNPDFNFVQLRSNMVMRWEYKPGSTLFLVWTQNRTDSPELTASNNLNRVANDIFGVYPHNIFLIKYTYRFIL